MKLNRNTPAATKRNPRSRSDRRQRTAAFKTLVAEAPRWEEASQPLGAREVGKFQALLTRVDPERVAAVITASTA